MDEENGIEYDEGSDSENWEIEQVFQDHEGQDEDDDEEMGDDFQDGPYREDFGYFGEMGVMED